MAPFSRRTLALLALVSALLAACSGETSDGTGDGECTPGQTRTLADGCNTCTCQPNGFFACSAKTCGTGGGSGAGGATRDQEADPLKGARPQGRLE